MDKEARLREIAEEGLAGLRRAAKAAEKLARETGTPFIVCRAGKVVDLNAKASTRSEVEEAEPTILREEPEED